MNHTSSGENSRKVTNYVEMNEEMNTIDEEKYISSLDEIYFSYQPDETYVFLALDEDPTETFYFTCGYRKCSSNENITKKFELKVPKFVLNILTALGISSFLG